MTPEVLARVVLIRGRDARSRPHVRSPGARSRATDERAPVGTTGGRLSRGHPDGLALSRNTREESGLKASEEENGRIEIGSLLDRPEVQRQIERARERFDSIDTQVRTMIKKQPFAVLGGVLALGYALGWLLSRR
jgi:hypothetical protein